jgi:hypothetical protein
MRDIVIGVLAVFLWTGLVIAAVQFDRAFQRLDALETRMTHLTGGRV